MFKALSVVLALAVAAAGTLPSSVEAASVGSVPELSAERLLTPVASKKRYKKYKARKCRKGKAYSKRRHKCVWKKKRSRGKTVAPGKVIPTPTKKK
jgi:hypothetical protein